MARFLDSKEFFFDEIKVMYKVVGLCVGKNVKCELFFREFVIEDRVFEFDVYGKVFVKVVKRFDVEIKKL